MKTKQLSRSKQCTAVFYELAGLVNTVSAGSRMHTSRVGVLGMHRCSCCVCPVPSRPLADLTPRLSGVFGPVMMSCTCRETVCFSIFAILFLFGIPFLAALWGSSMGKSGDHMCSGNQTQKLEREAEHIAKHLVRLLPQL